MSALRFVRGLFGRKTEPVAVASRADLTSEKQIGPLKRRIEQIERNVGDLDRRMREALESQGLAAEKMRLSLVGVVRQAERQAEQAEQTATALFERIEQLRNGGLTRAAGVPPDERPVRNGKGTPNP